MNFEATKKQKAIKCDSSNTAERISDVWKHLILVHAFGEYNTTSAAHQQGKLSVLKYLEKFKAARMEAHVFLQKNRTAETICETWVIIFVMITVEKIQIHWLIWDISNIWKWLHLQEMRKPESLPPTSRVERTNGKYPRSKRLGLKVRRCLFGANCDGCQEPARNELLKIRWCNCRVMLKNLCCGNIVLATPMGLSA